MTSNPGKKEYDICIIGGGASGLTAAITAMRRNPSLSVIVIEKMDVPGKKIAAAGNGRCNLSNTECSDWEKTAAFFSSIGLITRVDEEGRIYPYSEDGRDVVNALINEAERLGVEIIIRRSVTEIKLQDSSADGGAFNITAEFNKPKAYRLKDEDAPIEIKASKILIATGGKSKASLGTTGDGYLLAKKLGHRINKLVPVLTGVETEEDLKSISGIREKCNISLYKNNKLIFTERGAVQFADYGISGIVVFNMTRFMNLDDEQKGFYDFKIEIDFLPEFSESVVEEMLSERISKLGKDKALVKDEILEEDKIFIKDKVEALLISMVKKPISSYITEIVKSGVHDKRNNRDNHDIHNEPLDGTVTVKFLVNTLKHFTLNPINLKGWDMAQVTRGGVTLSEIDEATGESKLIPGLFFSGEMIDRDFQCGGFNLQHAWSSGIKAGERMAKLKHMARKY